MDGSVFSSAHGAVDSVIGRLTTLLVSEAQLLAGVRGDVEFISDEMGSMNGFVLHVSEAEYPDHQVRAWMKQVRDLAYSSEDCVDLYAQHVSAGPAVGGSGLFAYLRQLPWMLRTMPVRHQLANRIKELKVRAQEVGDRRHRYGVTVPPANVKPAPAPARPPAAAGDAEDLWRTRLALVNEPPANAKEDVYQLVEWLREPSGDDDLGPRVILVIGEPGADKTIPVRNITQHPDVKSCFNDVVWSTGVRGIIATLFHLEHLQDEKAHDFISKQNKINDIYGNPAVIDDSLVSNHLRGKKYLIVIDNVSESDVQGCLDKLRPLTSYSVGNAIIILTKSDEEGVKSFNFPHKVFTVLNFRSHPHFYFERAAALVGSKSHLMQPLGAILQKCYPDAFTIKMFLGFLCASPDRAVKELKDISSNLEGHYTSKNADTMLLSCYNDLPRHCRNALLYLAIFPVGCKIKRTNLVRRWVFEGFITQADVFGPFDALREANRCFHQLVLRGFLSATDTSVSGKVKSCTVHHLVHQFITGIARSVHFVDPGLPPELACHFSIRNRIGLEASRTNLASASGNSAMLALLESLHTSSQWQVLRVLDLEGCNGLKKHHLKSICKIILLKYLSLRNTDVTELPKEIQKLRCLETLDIRQTKIRAFALKHLTLPMLKHLLAGHKESADVTVRLPKGIRRMKNLEELCHVDASDNIDDVADIGHLLQLRKLGVVLQGRKSSLTLLFQQIDKLCACLCSLSIRVNTTRDITPTTEAVPALSSPPLLLESLNISGVIGPLPDWIENLNKLGKITLSNTHLGEDAILIIENLGLLKFLRLGNKSYTESKLTFRKDKFQSLEALDVEGEDITDIIFDNGAAPKLERIVWSFTTMQSLSGIEHLLKLKKIQVNGDCIPDPVKEDIKKHPNHHVLQHNLPAENATARP